MGNKNRIAASLALMAMAGFLAMFGGLCFVQIPVQNKDFFNMGFIALIGFVGTAFGYYLGSSLGSAHKNELLAPGAQGVPGTAPLAGPEGFARLPLLSVLALGCTLMLCAGCATLKTEGPEVTAGKALLAVKQTVVTAAVTADALCGSGQMSAENCDRARAAYEIAKPAYDSAVDAYLLMIQGGDPAAFGGALARLQGLAQNMAVLTGGAK